MINEIKMAGVQEFVYCPGKRNHAIVEALCKDPEVKIFPHFEERSAGFFALGRARATGLPVAVVTTSGTAVGELLPAVMEAYYTGVPLVLMTADRPERFRGTGAPQSCEQPGIFGLYAEENLKQWKKDRPLHLNICLEEPGRKVENGKGTLPLVMVSTLHPSEREAVKAFLLRVQAPVYLEAVSGLREDADLRKWRVQNPTLDDFGSVLRIGGVPTHRIWRDLEERTDIEVISVSSVPFSGLPGRSVVVGIAEFLENYQMEGGVPPPEVDLEPLFREYPRSEPAIMHALSKQIPADARVFLGNSLPIREWDAFAADSASSDVWASRGLNGIDGQLSAFFGLATPGQENWGIFGDLTTLYDLAAPWILPQLDVKVKIVVINNGGGMIFSRVGCGEEMLSRHAISFGDWAKMWNIDVLEIVPDEEETNRFWRAYNEEMRAARVPG